MCEPAAEFPLQDAAEALFGGVKFYVSGEVPREVRKQKTVVVALVSRNAPFSQALELLKRGGAERMNYFGDYVTHMLCGKDAEDTDLSDANEVYEVPAVTEKWVYMCAKLKRLVGTKPYVYNPSKLFSGLVFCLSKAENDLEALWAIVTYNGGVVQLNLDQNCTHLVTVNTSTPKYDKALALGPEKVTIITPDWLTESVKTNRLVSPELYHPKLIRWPKPIKHESTTAITGFEPPELDEKLPETSTADSTQALLDKLKQRMPWNQPQQEAPPPNVVAPSFTQKLPQMEQMRSFGQPSLAFQQTNPNVIVSNQQMPRSIVHHTAQQQQQFPQQPQQQFQQGQMQLNRLIGQQQQQQQQQQRPDMAQQLNKLNQLNPQSQFAQQLLQQRNQQQQQQPNQMMNQNMIQRQALTKGLGLQQMPHAQVIQHIQQIGNRPQLPASHLMQNQQQLLQQQQQNQMAQQQLNQTQLLQKQQLLQQQQQQFDQQQQILPQNKPQAQFQQQMPMQQQQQQQQFVGSPTQFVQNQQQHFVQQQQQQPFGQQQLLSHQQMLLNQQQQQQQQNLPFNQQQQQPQQQQRPIWQQQQVRHPALVQQQQQQGPRLQWSPNQQQQQQRQYIQLDAQTHQQLQQMAPEQRAAFVAKLQKQRQLLLQQRQLQMQQQRGGHILIRGW